MWHLLRVQRSTHPLSAGTALISHTETSDSERYYGVIRCIRRIQHNQLHMWLITYAWFWFDSIILQFSPPTICIESGTKIANGHLANGCLANGHLNVSTPIYKTTPDSIQLYLWTILNIISQSTCAQLRTNGPEHPIFVTETFIWIPYALTWDTNLQHHYQKVPAALYLGI